MWGIKKTIYDRQNNIIKSAIQKYARRCDYHKMSRCCLELLDSGSGRAALARLRVIAVEDKFPQGATMLPGINKDLKDWKKKSLHQQGDVIINRCAQMCSLPSDRHIAYLARVAMDQAVHGDGSETDQEIKMATECEKILLRVRIGKELPTPKDISREEAVKKLKDILCMGSCHIWGNIYEKTLFEMFETEYIKNGKGDGRLHLYTIVGMRFHKWSHIPPNGVVVTQNREKIEIDDFCFDKHTTVGRKRKRGMKHFLETGAHIENPHPDIHKRSHVKERAEKIYLEYEKQYDTRRTKSRLERKRIRESYLYLKYFHNQKVISQEMCQKPCGGKPATMWFKVEDGTQYFIKGPYLGLDKIRFQADIDKRKKHIKRMDIAMHNINLLYYLIAPRAEGFVNFNPGKFYNDEVLKNLFQVLEFRKKYNISDTNLRNVMVNMETNEVLSVDEMTPNRAKPKLKGDEDDFYRKLFNKLPRKSFLLQMKDLVRRNGYYDIDINGKISWRV